MKHSFIDVGLQEDWSSWARVLLVPVESGDFFYQHIGVVERLKQKLMDP